MLPDVKYFKPFELLQLADEFGFKFFETSAKGNVNVQEVISLLFTLTKIVTVFINLQVSITNRQFSLAIAGVTISADRNHAYLLATVGRVFL